MDGRSPERPVQSCASTVDVYGLGAVETVEEQPDGPGLSAIRGTQLPGCLHGPSSTRRRGDGARRGDEGKTTSAPVTGRECRAGHGRGLCSNLRGDFVGREVRHRDRWRAGLVTLAVKAVVPAALVVSVGWQIEGLPATSVRGPTHVVKTGKTPVLQPAEARLPLDAIDTSTLPGLRDRALLGVIVYSVARVAAVGLGEANCHTFRATGITAYLLNGGTLERAQAIAAHESPRTTKLYDRTADEVTIEDIEKIWI